MVNEAEVHDPTDKAGAGQAPATAAPDILDPLRSLRVVKWLTRLFVYPGVTALIPLDHALSGLTWQQAISVHLGGYLIATLAIEFAFGHVFKLRKHSSYPQIILEELDRSHHAGPAAERGLSVIQHLLKVRASFLALRDDDGRLNLVSASGMDQEVAQGLLQAATGEAREAMHSLRPVWFRPAVGTAVELRASRDDRLVFIPVMALHRLIGVLAVARGGGKGDLKDGQLLANIGGALGLSLERLRREQELRESQERLRTVIASTPIVMFSLDREGVFLLAEGRGLDKLGFHPSHVLGRSVFEECRDLPQVLENVHRAFAGESFTSILEVNERLLEAWLFPVLDESGEISGITGVVTDVTDRKRAEAALQESEAKFRTLTETVAAGAFIYQGTRFRYVNSATEELTGYSREELLAMNFWDLVHPDYQELVKQRGLARQRGEDVPGRYEAKLVTKGGEVRWADLTLGIIEFEGKPAVLGTAFDITERKRAEEERERLHSELEVRAITDSLTGLYDHAHFYQHLAQEIERSKRYNHGFALVMMDVDDFKRFNDSRGHQAGDEALRLVADCIRTGLRRSDLAFRYGGDEFAAILPHADSPKARAAVNRINERIARRVKKTDGRAAAQLTLSAGIACFQDDGTTADDLVRVADAALYSAKWVARARDIMGQREDIQSLVSALVSRRAGAEVPTAQAPLRPEALHEQRARIVSSVASSIAVALKDAGVAQALEDPDMQILATVGAAAEIKDRYIRGHPERTSRGAMTLAEEIGLPPERVRDIGIAGLLHDIGKVTVSEGILNKPGKLTRREFATIREHPIVGATLVSQVRGFDQLIPIIRHHHERFDGKGYPDGLAGAEIPLEARILSVVDVFDALTHQRSYRNALSREEAMGELERGAGTQFDPAVLKAFLALVERRGDELAATAQAASEDRQLAEARAPGRARR
jgi:diguanylate cyclase (GGDEF)-like protein/PAS domain S-box-containing protein/putative nucleotidyltransferase with HDIG domain